MDSLPIDITNEILKYDYLPNSVTCIFKLINKWYNQSVKKNNDCSVWCSALYYYIRNNNLAGVKWFYDAEIHDEYPLKIAIIYNCDIEIIRWVWPDVNLCELNSLYFTLQVALSKNRADVFEVMVEKYNRVNWWIFMEAVEQCKYEIVKIMLPYVSLILPSTTCTEMVSKASPDLYNMVQLLGDNKKLTNHACCSMIELVYNTRDDPCLLKLILNYVTGYTSVTWREERVESNKLMYTECKLAFI
jgi:hypothetical protein